jgi:Domain of unknown function (DUF5615)
MAPLSDHEHGGTWMKFGKCRFYADENIEPQLVELLRDEGFRVDTAAQLGFAPRDDKFHLQEAKRRKALLLTRDNDFLDHQRFPFSVLNDTGIIFVRTAPGAPADTFRASLAALVDLGYSGNHNLHGTKVEIAGPILTFHARIGGRIMTDKADIRVPGEQELFADDD